MAHLQHFPAQLLRETVYRKETYKEQRRCARSSTQKAAAQVTKRQENTQESLSQEGQRLQLKWLLLNPLCDGEESSGSRQPAASEEAEGSGSRQPAASEEAEGSGSRQSARQPPARKQKATASRQQPASKQGWQRQAFGSQRPVRKQRAATAIPLMAGKPQGTRLATTAPSTTPAIAHQFTTFSGAVPSRYSFLFVK